MSVMFGKGFIAFQVTKIKISFHSLSGKLLDVTEVLFHTANLRLILCDVLYIAIYQK
jgi:hypothetical protein